MTILGTRRQLGIVRFLGAGVVEVALTDRLPDDKCGVIASLIGDDRSPAVTTNLIRVAWCTDEESFASFIGIVDVVIGELKLPKDNTVYWQCFYLPEAAPEFRRVRASNPEILQAMNKFFA